MNVYRVTSGPTQRLVQADTTGDAVARFCRDTGADPRDTRAVMLP